MESGPEFRIVGGASKEAGDAVRKKYESAFSAHLDSLSKADREALEKLEYPKSDDEIGLINFANEETSRLMFEVGASPYDIPVENYHIVPTDLYKKAAGDSGDAAARATNQGIVFDASVYKGNPIYFGSVAIHETLHLKAKTSFEVEEVGEKVSDTLYRQGVSIRAPQKIGLSGGFHEHFLGLHEAIVSEQQKRSFPQLLKRPEVQDEVARLNNDEALGLKRKIAESRKVPEDEIIWVGKNEKEWERFSYSKQRNVLTFVCNEIQKEFPDEFKTVDDVFTSFLHAHFTGELLPIARFVEKTFGEGSFRILGNMDSTATNGTLTLETLKKARLRVEKVKSTN